MKPTAAPAYFPYRHHRRMDEVIRQERQHELAELERERMEAEEKKGVSVEQAYERAALLRAQAAERNCKAWEAIG